MGTVDILGRRRLLALAAGGVAMAAMPRPGFAANLAAPDVSKGAHDLTGVWTDAWYTHLQRPRELTTLVLTPAQAEAYEAPRRANAGEIFSVHDELGQAMSEFNDNGPGLARIDGQIRASWITEPADGRIPWRPKVKMRIRPGEDVVDFENVEARDTDERCLTSSGAGAPIVNSHDGNLVTLVLTGAPGKAGWLAVVGEKNHEVRIVRIVGTGPTLAQDILDRGQLDRDPPSWWGTSLGHWDGATLVVGTDGFRRGITKVSDDVYLSEHSQVTERFTRTGPAEIRYGFKVTDETLFTRSWRGEMVFRPAEGAMYEYACHEGNYSLPGILAGARAAIGK